MAKPTSARRTSLGPLLDAWVVVVTLLVVWPLVVRRGYVFSRDAVFTPAIPLRPEVVGVGTGTPRAVPLDAVVALTSRVVDGEVLGPVLIAGALLLAGMAAHRLVPKAAFWARGCVGALAIWNPFVLERLGLGQWALILGYAATLHVVRVARSRPTAGRLAPWLAVGAVTPTGAVLVGVTAVCLTAGRPRWKSIAGLALLVQTPWVLPALVGGGALLSDPAGIGAFAARPERSGGVLWTLVGQGGLWDSLSVPGSRRGFLGHLTSAVGASAVLYAVAKHRSAVGRRLIALGALAVFVAALTSWEPGAELLTRLTAQVPGIGLVRDAQKWLPPFIALLLVSVTISLDAVLKATRRRLTVMAPAAAVVAMALPFLLLPDGVVIVHAVMRPVDYPPDFAQVRDRVAGQEGVMVSLPWQLYRQYPWAGDYATHDPASRWFDIRVVSADALVLGDRVVEGEDAYSRAVGRVLEPETPEASAVQGLRELGVRYLLESSTERARTWSDIETRLVWAGEALRLYEIEAHRPDRAPRQPASLVWLVAGADILVLAVVVTVAVLGRTSRSARSVTLW